MDYSGYELEGVYTAIVTPFQGDTIDVTGLQNNVRHQCDNGIKGIVALGTTGETPTLRSEEKDLVIQTVVDACQNDALVIVGTGTNCTRHTIEQTRRAKELGADVALVVTPYYNKPSQAGILAHFKAVAQEGGLPIIVYNIEGRAAVNITTDTMVELSMIPGVIGVKEASGSINQIADVIHRIQYTNPGFRVLSGDDSITLPLMALGGKGVISVTSNVAPKLFCDLVSAALREDYVAARDVYHTMLPLYRVLFSETNPGPIKAAMDLAGLSGGSVRLPLVPASEATRATISKVLHDLALVS